MRLCPIRCLLFQPEFTFGVDILKKVAILIDQKAPRGQGSGHHDQSPWLNPWGFLLYFEFFNSVRSRTTSSSLYSELVVISDIFNAFSLLIPQISAISWSVESENSSNRRL